jgi:hypothetical protein
MKSLLKPYLVCLTITVIILNYGCKKSDPLDTDMGLSRIKVYDDTLASFKNSSGRIASATDRIYMTYGLGADDLYAIYASGYAANPAITKLNALDNKGNLLWQKTLPTNIVIKGLLGMDDGGCLLAGVNLLENPFLQNLFFYRYDRNGS